MLPTFSATKMPLVYVVLLGQLHTASATCTDMFTGVVYNYKCGETCQNTPCTCPAMFDFVNANTGSCPDSKPCKTTAGCCGACSTIDKCWAYKCGETCQDTPCTCPAMFDFVNTNTGSCPDSKPCKTTTGCCGACSTIDKCWAYSCTDSAGNTYCSDAPCDEDCNNSCQSININDGTCDDGGAGSAYSFCALGTDCADCGTRASSSGTGSTTPPPPPHSHCGPPAICPGGGSRPPKKKIS